MKQKKVIQEVPKEYVANVNELQAPVNQQKILSRRPVIKALFDPLGAH